MAKERGEMRGSNIGSMPLQKFSKVSEKRTQLVREHILISERTHSN
jgi:hypothetical protein